MGNLVFPLDIAGAQPNLRRKPVFATSIQTSSGGSELRASWQSFPRYRYTLSLEVMRSDVVYAEFQRIASSFAAAMGQYDTFLLIDPNDSVVNNMGFAVTDGKSTAFQLQRTLVGSQRTGYWDSAIYPVNTSPRFNLLLQSQTLDSATWTKSNVTIGVNARVAPDGGPTADAILEGGTGTVQYSIAQTAVSGIATASGYYTMSAYVYPSARQMCILQMKELTGNTTCGVWFNFLTKSVGASSSSANWTNVSAKVIDAGGGWFRVSMSAFKANGASSIACTLSFAAIDGVVSYTGTTGMVSGYVWGIQLEAGAALNGYLPTLTIPVRDDPAYWPNFGDGFEPITEVNAGTLAVFLNGQQQSLITDYDYDGSGLINFKGVPASGQFLTWSGNYFRRVRFANDDLELERIFGQLWSGKTIDFISVK